KLRALKYDAFRKLWHQLTPYIQIMSPRTDLCDTCQQLRNDLQFKARKEEPQNLLKKYKEHLAKAKLERNYYNKIQSWRKNIESSSTNIHRQMLMPNFDIAVLMLPLITVITEPKMSMCLIQTNRSVKCITFKCFSPLFNCLIPSKTR